MPLSPRDHERLVGVHPDLAAKVEMLVDAFGLFVAQGVRTAAYQASLFAAGRTTPGPIVTNCDGVIKKSNHQPHLDGYGHAVDLAVQGKNPYPTGYNWIAMGEKAESLGLVWGGRFHLVDLDHVELRDTPA